MDFAKPRPGTQVLAASDSVPCSATGPTANFQTAAGAENYFATEDDNFGGIPSLPMEDSSLNDGDSLFYGDWRKRHQPAV